MLHPARLMSLGVEGHGTAPPTASVLFESVCDEAAAVAC